MLREAGTDLVQVGGKGGLLELARSGRRYAWHLPHVDVGLRPNRRGGAEGRWPWRCSPQLVLLFLGWLIEGSLAPTKRGGLVSWAAHRWIIGARSSWADLLGCSARTLTRLVAELAELGLVEQQRLVVDKTRRQCREVPAAYRPGPALIAWLAGTPPATLGGRTRFPSSGASPRPSGGGEDSVDPPEGGHGSTRAEPDPENRAPESGLPAQGPQALAGTLPAASAAAPVGDGRPASAPQLPLAGFPAWPATPPADQPPVASTEFVPPAEVAALGRVLAGQYELELGIALRPLPPDELEAKRRAYKSRLEARLRRDDEPGGAS